jgi:hypothetical protein
MSGFPRILTTSTLNKEWCCLYAVIEMLLLFGNDRKHLIFSEKKYVNLPSLYLVVGTSSLAWINVTVETPKGTWIRDKDSCKTKCEPKFYVLERGPVQDTAVYTIDYPYMIQQQFDIRVSAYHVFLNTTPQVKQGMGLLLLLRRLSLAFTQQ